MEHLYILLSNILTVVFFHMCVECLLFIELFITKIAINSFCIWCFAFCWFCFLFVGFLLVSWLCMCGKIIFWCWLIVALVTILEAIYWFVSWLCMCGETIFWCWLKVTCLLVSWLCMCDETIFWCWLKVALVTILLVNCFCVFILYQ